MDVASHVRLCMSVSIAHDVSIYMFGVLYGARVFANDVYRYRVTSVFL